MSIKCLNILKTMSKCHPYVPFFFHEYKNSLYQIRDSVVYYRLLQPNVTIDSFGVSRKYLKNIIYTNNDNPHHFI